MIVGLQQHLIISLFRRSGSQSVFGVLFNSRQKSVAHNAGIESSKHMQKLLTRKGAKTKRKWYQPHIAEALELSGKRQQPNKHGISQAQGHRARQLSHVLYAKICQIANSGELDEEVVNKQVLFTRVKMHPAFSGINVFWDANRADSAEIETLLNGLSGKLRSLLISYHVLGRIPTITFVKDQSKGDLARLNQLFEVADYGPDYFPSTETEETPHIMLNDEISARFSRSSAHEQAPENLHQDFSALSLGQSLDMEESIKPAGDSLEILSAEAGWQPQPEHTTNEKVSSKVSTNSSDEPFSYFRSNLYGLPREDLMKKVLAKKKKVKYQNSSDNNLATISISDPQSIDYRKFRSKIADKEKVMRQRDSTKVKQQLLQQEFDEVQESLNGEFTDDDRLDDNSEDDNR